MTIYCLVLKTVCPKKDTKELRINWELAYKTQIPTVEVSSIIAIKTTKELNRRGNIAISRDCLHEFTLLSHDNGTDAFTHTLSIMCRFAGL